MDVKTPVNSGEEQLKNAATGDPLTGAPLAGTAPGNKPRFAWASEAFFLKNGFRVLLAGTVLFLALDFFAIYEAANVPLPGKVTERSPLTMAPPKPADQLRPYLPRTHPQLRKGQNPVMPGFLKPPGHELIGKVMSFTRGPKGAVSAIGRIEPGTGAAFTKFIETQGGEIKTLYLHSPGGSVEDALIMSKYLRREGIDTVVPKNGYCASSCPIVFSGGKNRNAGKTAWIGVHQVFAVTSTPGKLSEGMARGQSVSARIQDHLATMGVDLRVWVKAMQTPSDQLYIFTPVELKEFKLATRVGSF